MTEDAPARGYRIEELAHRSGSTVRTIRAYQDRGLLPKPERRGRANVYGDEHLARLRQIAELLDRGYGLTGIKELLEAWSTGRGLAGVLGPVAAEVDVDWSEERATRLTRAELAERFGGEVDDGALAEAVELGVLEPVPGQDGTFHVPSPAELAVAAELHAAGVPLSAVSSHLRELRTQIEHIAGRFVDFTTEYVFQQYLDPAHPPSEAEAVEAAALVRRMRPLAQRTVDAELARAMRTRATSYLRHHLDAPTTPGPGRDAGSERGSGSGSGPGPELGSGPGSELGSDREGPDREPVLLPAETLAAVRTLVGPADTPAFIAAAADREVGARTMDALAERHGARHTHPEG